MCNKMIIFDKIEKFVKDVFKTTLDIFLDALKLSPNAQGYVSGSVTELLLKNEIEGSYKCEVKRIREKWEGKKHPNHHGDFYFRINKNSSWYVLESKGVKSNSEKWHKLYNYDNLIKFLYNHSDKIPWIDHEKDDIEDQIKIWIMNELPKFLTEYRTNLYDYEEIQKYLNNPPIRETEKSRAIEYLKNYSRDEINSKIDERLAYLMEKIRVLETHFVSGVSGSSDRTQATPRKDEFNIISIDIFLRHSEHKFIYANPKLLESSGGNEDHLQQNYIMGFVFKSQIAYSDEWNDDFLKVYDTLNEEDSIKETDMQIDNRQFIRENE